MVGMLAAIPKTPLYDRLAAEGRLDDSDQPEFGTNVSPAGMTRAELREGYVKLLQELYQPHAYFERLDSLFLDKRFHFSQTRAAFWHRHPWNWLKVQTAYVAMSAGILFRLMQGVHDSRLRRKYRSRIFRLLRVRPDPEFLFVYLIKCAMHYHHHTMARQMASCDARIVNSF